jgi:FMN reductase
MPLSVVGLSGSLRRPSRTAVLAGALLAAVDHRLSSKGRLIALSDVAPTLFRAFSRDAADAEAEAIIEAVEKADVLVVATPVYRGSYTGALKHLFDLIRHDALVGKPVILAATGGSHLHGLVTEHALRPLLSFFNTVTVPTAIYATEADFTAGQLASVAVRGRIERAADELDRLLVRPADDAIQTARHRPLLAVGP